MTEQEYVIVVNREAINYALKALDELTPLRSDSVITISERAAVMSKLSGWRCALDKLIIEVEEKGAEDS